MKLTIKIVKQAEGFKAWCPALPGCRVHADTKQELYQEIRSAIDGYISRLDRVLPRELAAMMETEAA